MDDPRGLWQNQEVEEMKISVEELRAKAAKFQRRMRMRNIREYIAALFVIGVFADFYLRMPYSVPRIAFAMIIAGSMYYMIHLRRWGSSRFLPAEMGRADCLQFHRGELVRQRDLARSAWLWALGPIAPGMALFFAWDIATAPPAQRWHRIASVAASVAIVVAVLWMSRRAARRLDGRIAELNRDLAASV
jgi:hypothetical protein